jgi:hypothetical protein
MIPLSEALPHELVERINRIQFRGKPHVLRTKPSNDVPVCGYQLHFDDLHVSI